MNTSQSTSAMALSSPLLDCGIDLDVINIVVRYFYFVLFVPSFLLNVMAAWISWNINTNSSFIVYLKNLVAADLLMTLLMPLRGADRLPGSSLALRAFNCRFGSVFFYLCMYVSIVLMGVISLDRFFKIVQPGGKVFGQSALFGKVVSAGVWIFLLSTTTIPTIALTNENPQSNITSAELCMAMKSDRGKAVHHGVIMFCNVLFLIVLVVITFCYTCIAKRVVESYRNSGSKNVEGKRKIKARVFIVLVVFLVCFGPYHMTRFLYVKKQVENKINCNWAALKVAKSITLLLSVTNVCQDPLIYFLLCTAFRRKLHEIKLFKNCFKSMAQVNSEDTSL